MLCNIKPVPFHESDKHIFAKIPGGGGGPDPPRSPPPSGSAHEDLEKMLNRPLSTCLLTCNTARTLIFHFFFITGTYKNDIDDTPYAATRFFYMATS